MSNNDRLRDISIAGNRLSKAANSLAAWATTLRSAIDNDMVLTMAREAERGEEVTAQLTEAIIMVMEFLGEKERAEIIKNCSKCETFDRK